MSKNFQKLAILDINTRKVFIFFIDASIEISDEFIQDRLRFKIEDVQWMVYDGIEFDPIIIS